MSPDFLFQTSFRERGGLQQSSNDNQHCRCRENHGTEFEGNEIDLEAREQGNHRQGNQSDNSHQEHSS